MRRIAVSLVGDGDVTITLPATTAPTGSMSPMFPLRTTGTLLLPG